MGWNGLGQWSSAGSWPVDAWLAAREQAPGANQGPASDAEDSLPDRTATSPYRLRHDGECEADWIGGAMGHTDCGCAERGPHGRL